MRYTAVLFALLVASRCLAAESARQVFVVPNFHPASCGWLADWSTERNYCANSYYDHLDRVRDDSTYNFALSECNNMIAMLNFNPARFEELKQRVREGRVELCNAFFLEPTINLSGGEALVKMGVEGLRWQKQVMGVSPRFSWMIDVTGVHEQMAQIVTGLGLEALVYCRLNPSGSTLHWFQSPEGTRALAVSPGHYLEWRPMFGARSPLNEKQLSSLADDIRMRLKPISPEQNAARPDAGDLRSRPRNTPANAPVLILGGSGDYNLAPLCKEYPSVFLKQFKQAAPEFDVQFATPGRYLDVVEKGLTNKTIQVPVVKSGTAFTYDAFWIQNPKVKSWYRICEQELQAAETFASVASLKGKFTYPVQPLYHAWLEMLLNMDRNTLWGAAGGMVFENEKSWDVRDRFESVQRISRGVLAGAAYDMGGPGTNLAVFNSLGWQRNDPVMLPMPVGSQSQAIPGRNEYLCRMDMPSVSVMGSSVSPSPTRSAAVPLPEVIETHFYKIKVNASNGSLTSIQLKLPERELLAAPANVIVAERPQKPVGPGDHMVVRSQRQRLMDSQTPLTSLIVTTGALATVVEAKSAFIGGGVLRRQMIFYHDYPRIDFETELNDIPDKTVVVAEFPLASAVKEVRRGIPYGFSHAAWTVPNTNLFGIAEGITPAVRWSHYQMDGFGMGLFDQGLTGREINGNTPVLYLLSAVEKYRGYPNSWLSGSGKHVLRYAIVPHNGDFLQMRIAQSAWEFGQPPLIVPSCGMIQPETFLRPSENLILEAVRREGDELELRMAECLGKSGTGMLSMYLPHSEAAVTDMLGGHRQILKGGPEYRFPVRPQQIVTLRFKTKTSVPEIKVLTKWDDLVPPSKRAALNRYLPDVKGHPPAGGN